MQLWEKLHLSKKQLAIAAAVIAAGLVYHFAAAVLNKPQPVAAVPYVRTVTAGTHSTQNYLVYPGEVRGRYESNLAFQVSGKIISRNVNLGDTVHAGDVLMQIDPRDVDENVNAARAGLASANANFLLASDNEKRYRSLLASGAVSQAVYDQYNTQLKAAQSTLEQAEAQLAAALNQLDYTRLVANNDGVISSITGEVGQVAAAGTPVATLVRAHLHTRKQFSSHLTRANGGNNLLGAARCHSQRAHPRNRPDGRPGNAHLSGLRCYRQHAAAGAAGHDG